jgi:ABC-type lipoprotein release transport system permease subunit
VTFGAVAAVLVLTTLVASYLPARRAVAVEPQTALKSE